MLKYQSELESSCAVTYIDTTFQIILQFLTLTLYGFCQRYAPNMSLAKSPDTKFVTHNSLSQTSKFVTISVTKL